jgi:hypothetical protein
MKTVARNLEYVFPVFQFLRNLACLRVEGGNFQHLLKHAVKILPRTGHEGPDGEQRYSSTLSLTLALDVGGW